MDGRARLTRWIADNPVAVDRLLIGAGFLASLAAFANLVAAGVLVLVGIAGLRVAARLFGRESILTRLR